MDEVVIDDLSPGPPRAISRGSCDRRDISLLRLSWQAPLMMEGWHEVRVDFAKRGSSGHAAPREMVSSAAWALRRPIKEGGVEDLWRGKRDRQMLYTSPV